MSIRPAKFLKFNINTMTDKEIWEDPISPGQWQYATYIWNVTGSIEGQPHGSPDTQTPFQYDSLDIKAGDWVSDLSGRILRVVTVNSADGYSIDMDIEDVDQFNTYSDPSVSGYGGLTSYTGFVFSVNDDGAPELQNIPVGYLPAEAIFNIQNRLEYRNITVDYVRVFQTNNGFVVGDFITTDDEAEGRYKLVSSTQLNLAVGIVNTVGVPGGDWFTFKPLSGIVDDVEPPLVGEYGDIFYLDPANPGKITNVKPAIAPKPVYIRLENENRAVRLNAIADTDTETRVFKFTGHIDNQVEFQMPQSAADVKLMSINGIENTNFVFDSVTKMITFDPIETGYIVEASDEVIFTYVTFN